MKSTMLPALLYPCGGFLLRGDHVWRRRRGRRLPRHRRHLLGLLSGELGGEGRIPKPPLRRRWRRVLSLRPPRLRWWRRRRRSCWPPGRWRWYRRLHRPRRTQRRRWRRRRRGSFGSWLGWRAGSSRRRRLKCWSRRRRRWWLGGLRSRCGRWRLGGRIFPGSGRRRRWSLGRRWRWLGLRRWWWWWRWRRWPLCCRRWWRWWRRGRWRGLYWR